MSSCYFAPVQKSEIIYIYNAYDLKCTRENDKTQTEWENSEDSGQKYARRFTENARNVQTSTARRAGWLLSLFRFCFLPSFHPSSHNLTAAKHECGSEKIYARCVHASALCTSEPKYEHESRSCHPPGLCSYLCALLPSEPHGAPCEFLMLLVTLILKRTGSKRRVH